MELTGTQGTTGATVAGRRGWKVRIGLAGAAVAVAAALVVPRIGSDAAGAGREQVAPAVAITLPVSETSLEAFAKKQSMLRVIGGMDLPATSTVCLPCIVRQHPTQVVGGRPA